MSYDEDLAQRVRVLLKRRRGLSERKMFGGLAFLLRGHLCCGVLGRDLMVRVGPEEYEKALARPHAREMDFTGRPMKGIVYVGPAGTRTGRQLGSWVDVGVRFAGSLPPKKPGRSRGGAKWEGAPPHGPRRSPDEAPPEGGGDRVPAARVGPPRPRGGLVS